MTSTTKKYPFSMRKNGTDIELAYNTLQNKIFDEVATAEEEQFFYQLQELYSPADNVIFVTGKEYGLLMKAIQFANEFRNGCQYNY